MNAVRLDFDKETQKWVLFTPVALNLQQLHTVVKYTKEVYKKRLQGEIGSRRKQIENALLSLSVDKIHQAMTGKGDKTIYYAGKY